MVQSHVMDQNHQDQGSMQDDTQLAKDSTTRIYTRNSSSGLVTKKGERNEV